MFPVATNARGGAPQRSRSASLKTEVEAKRVDRSILRFPAAAQHPTARLVIPLALQFFRRTASRPLGESYLTPTQLEKINGGAHSSSHTEKNLTGSPLYSKRFNDLQKRPSARKNFSVKKNAAILTPRRFRGLILSSRDVLSIGSRRDLFVLKNYRFRNNFRLKAARRRKNLLARQFLSPLRRLKWLL